MDAGGPVALPARSHSQEPESMPMAAEPMEQAVIARVHVMALASERLA